MENSRHPFIEYLCPRQGLVLVEAEVDRKENEIVVAPKILQQVNLSGAIVIGDAMHAQRETSAQIVKPVGITCGRSKAISLAQHGPSKSCLSTKYAT